MPPPPPPLPLYAYCMRSMELEYAAHVGPGSYSADYHTVARSASKARSKSSSAFASTSLRGDLFMGGPG